MKVVGLKYTPERFTVRQGVPVEWHVDGSGAQGCAQVLTAPAFGLTTLLKTDQPNVLTFTPDTIGTFQFRCSMGMTNPNAAFIVVPNDSAADTTPTAPNNS